MRHRFGHISHSYTWCRLKITQGELYRIASTKLYSVLQEAGSTIVIPNTTITLSHLTIWAAVQFSQAQWPQLQGPPAFKQAIFLPISCQPTTNSLQSVDSALWSLSMATRLQCHISPSRAVKDWPPLTDPHNTRPLSCSAFSPAAVSWTTSGG